MKREELKQRLIELLRKAERHAMTLDNEDYWENFSESLIANGVTIRERGEWRFACVRNGKKFYKCSNCWHAFPSVDKESCEETCPYCGADMRGVTEPPETEKGGAEK